MFPHGLKRAIAEWCHHFPLSKSEGELWTRFRSSLFSKEGRQIAQDFWLL